MIRINLLAEEQAAEEMRRRDPVKRAIMGAVALVVLMLAWVVSLQMKVMTSNGLVDKTEAQWKGLEKQDALIRTNRSRTVEIDRKLSALAHLSTNRFLWSAPLNALQFCVIDNIELTSVSGVQTYGLTQAKLEGKKEIAPATSTEEISLAIRGLDYAPGNQGNHTKFMDAIAKNPYFKDHLRRPDPFKDVERSTSQSSESGDSKAATFAFKCQFPSKVR